MAKINELFPRKAYFNISGVKTPLCIEPITIGKYADAMNEIGDIDLMLSSGKVIDICKILFFFLNEESKKLFAPKKIKVIDGSTGKYIIQRIGGYNLLMKCLSDQKDITEMTVSLLAAMGHKKTDIEKMLSEEEESIKKKVNQLIGG